MRILGRKGSSEKSMVPVTIRKPTCSGEVEKAFVVSIVDAVSSPDLYRRLQLAENAYEQAVEKWRGFLADIQKERSNAVLRWRLAEDIGRLEKRMRDEWGLYPTNMLDAVARDVGMSSTALGYTLRLRRRFTLKEVKASGINWSKFREVLDIRDDALMKKCVTLIMKGEIRTDAQIRAFRRKANSGQPV